MIPVLGTVSSAEPPPVVKLVDDTRVAQVATSAPRASVTVTLPSLPEMVSAPDPTAPRFADSGTVMLSPPAVIVNVTVVFPVGDWASAASAPARATPATRDMAATAAATALR